MSELIPFRMMVDCYMFAWDAPEDSDEFFVPGLSYRRDARDCQVCWYWCGETDDAVFCSFPNYRAEKIMEESDDDDAPGEAHGYATWEEIYPSHSSVTRAKVKK